MVIEYLQLFYNLGKVNEMKNLRNWLHYICLFDQYNIYLLPSICVN